MDDLGFASEMPAKRKSGDPTIGVPPVIHGEYSAWCERNAFVKREITGRLLKWFMSCDDVLRKVITGGTVQGLEKESADAIEAIAQEVRDSAKMELASTVELNRRREQAAKKSQKQAV